MRFVARSGWVVVVLCVVACSNETIPVPPETPAPAPQVKSFNCSSKPVPSTAAVTPLVTDLLKGIAVGTTWDQLPKDVQTGLTNNAQARSDAQRKFWSPASLVLREGWLFNCATVDVKANMALVDQQLFAGDVSPKFNPYTDLKSPEFSKQLQRMYLALFAQRRNFMFYTLGDVNSKLPLKDWDGSELKAHFYIRDADTLTATRAYAKSVYDAMKAIPDAKLNALELAIRPKAISYLRQLMTASSGYSYGGYGLTDAATASDAVSSYLSNVMTPGYADDLEYFLSQLNAATFAVSTHLDVGSAFSGSTNMAGVAQFLPTLGDVSTVDSLRSVSLLWDFWGQRMQALPDAQKPCTLYSAAELDDVWNGFTAEQLADNERATTLQSYSDAFAVSLGTQLTSLRTDAANVLNMAFVTDPVGKGLLTADQLAQVVNLLNSETRLGAMTDTMDQALRNVTHSSVPSAHLQKWLGSVVMIGGGYPPGVPVSDVDKDAVKAAWQDVVTYISLRFDSKYPVNLSKLLPTGDQLDINSTRTTYAADGVMHIGVGNAVLKSSLYRQLLHEAKHLIDANNGSIIKGAANEGLAAAIDRMVWPVMLKNSMTLKETSQGMFYVYTYLSNLESARTFAITDAVLKNYLRSSCSATSSDAVTYARGNLDKHGVPSAGDEGDSNVFRALMGTQYLSYQYGVAATADVLDYLQKGIGATPDQVWVTPYLLQACGMPAPSKSQASIDKLKVCTSLKM